MTKVSASELEKLARLSNLSLDPAEIPNLTKDLNNILDYVNQLSEVDTDGVEPTYQVTGLQNVWREDELVDEVVTPDQLLELVGDNKQQQQIKVPKVL